MAPPPPPSDDPDSADPTAAPPGGNVVLTGFMGTGKTSTGRLLADLLGLEFVDTDELIEQRHGPIDDIFAQRGEAEFRALENEVATELGARSGLVIATGGRLMLDPKNHEALGRTGRIFCLTAAVDEIVARVTDDESEVVRPLLTGPDPAGRVRALLKERQPDYARFAQVATDGSSPEEVAAEIAQLLAAPPVEINRPGVLFLCVHNAGRSQMGAGWLRHLGAGRVAVYSAGSNPAAEVNPVAVEVMAEVGIDITDAEPQKWTDDMVRAVDVVVSMGCGDTCPVYPGTRYLDWELTDPAGEGVELVRRVRDEIRGHVVALLAELDGTAP